MGAACAAEMLAVRAVGQRVVPGVQLQGGLAAAGVWFGVERGAHSLVAIHQFSSALACCLPQMSHVKRSIQAIECFVILSEKFRFALYRRCEGRGPIDASILIG